MPWFPDFVAAVELARRDERAAGQADPVGQYLSAIERGDAGALESRWPGEVSIFDPHAGAIRDHQHLLEFVEQSQALLAEHHARIETVASTSTGGRAVVEYLAHVDRAVDQAGERIAWPVAVVAEFPDDRSVVFRIYCSQWQVFGLRPVRAPVLEATAVHPGGVVGSFLTALAVGDTGTAVDTFAPSGYLRDPLGRSHRGPDELRSFFTAGLRDGGIGLELCQTTDDGVRCAAEYNCVRWGSRALVPQAGMAVFERGDDGSLVAARFYDDVEPPSVA
jgi:hypothetical protein